MLELSVKGMTCNGCISSVTRAVKRIDAAAGVEVDLSSGRVRVEGGASREDVVRAISAAGFEVAIPSGAAEPAKRQRGCCCG